MKKQEKKRRMRIDTIGDHETHLYWKSFSLLTVNEVEENRENSFSLEFGTIT